MIGLTARQEQVLTFIRRHVVDHQRFPTHREICTAFGWSSTGAAVEYFTALEAKGALTRGPSGQFIIAGLALEWRPAGAPPRAELEHQLELARTALKEFA